MKRSQLFWSVAPWAAGVLLTACTSLGSVSGSAPVGRFDFQYRVQGDVATRPYQVFDDGQNTYFQFRQTPDKLEAGVSTPSGIVSQDIEPSVNYVQAYSVATSWELKENGKTYVITYTGPARKDRIKAKEIAG